MPGNQIDAALAQIAMLEDDRDGQRDVLERVSLAFLHRPALGGQLVARLCAAEEGAAELEPLTDLLGSALEAACIARENRKKRGETFLQAVNDAVTLASGQRRIGPMHRLLLASIWARSGLQAPAALALTPEEMDASAPAAMLKDRAAADAMLDDLFRDLIEQTGGDALGLHAALTETFPAMPAELRDHVVAWSVERPEPIHARLACFWLLDPSPSVRLAAARALAARRPQRALAPSIAADLVTLRNWMPEDEARKCVDQLVKDFLRDGIATIGERINPWAVRGVLATLPDGGGAQSIGIALQSGNQHKAAMLLLKQGFGVKDAYVIPCATSSEQKSLMRQLVEETGAQEVPADWLVRALPMALAEGVAAGTPPAPGLIEVANLCGLSDLRPEPATTEVLISALPFASRLAALSVQARGKLVNASGDWWERHEMVQSWFEESDGAHDLLKQSRSMRAMERALWKWLETRRDWWARIVARGADTLAAASHPDAESFAATAMALMEGRDLQKIPVMEDVHEQTIEAWMFDDPDADQFSLHDDVPEAFEAPQPERKGELARLVKGSTVSADWIDGFLMGVVLAPKMITPSRWLPLILSRAMQVLDPATIQRFIEIVMMRATSASDQAASGTLTLAGGAGKGKQAMRDWARGFGLACDHFRSSWPAKTTSADDRAMIGRAADAMTTGFSETELRTLAQWITARHARNIEQS